MKQNFWIHYVCIRKNTMIIAIVVVEIINGQIPIHICFYDHPLTIMMMMIVQFSMLSSSSSLC